MSNLFFDIACPHCLKENALLTGFSERKRYKENVYDVAFFCNRCEQASIAVVQSDDEIGPYESCQPFGWEIPENHPNVDKQDIIIRHNHSFFRLIKVYPEPKVIKCPENTPRRATKFFLEGKVHLQHQRYETCVMICRKVIDISTKELLGDEVKNEKLSQRISMLQAKDRITEQMKNWAHIIRIDSNGAVHSDEEFTQEEAEEILNFTELFLLYAFTLPAMVKSRKHATTC